MPNPVLRLKELIYEVGGTKIESEFIGLIDDSRPNMNQQTKVGGAN